MSVKAANPYLFFNGNGKQAVELYKSALGAEVISQMLYGEQPASAASDRDRIMHAELRIGDATVLLSDRDTQRAAQGSAAGQQNVHVTLQTNDVEDTRKKFEAMAKRGEVLSPFEKTFWGATFGVVKDEFGIHWMFNCTS